MNSARFSSRRKGFTMVEVLVTVALIMALSAIAFSLAGSMRQKAEMSKAMSKLRNLGTALVAYTSGSNGLLPYEDAPGSDDWDVAADPIYEDVWYNALPRQMGSPGVGDLAETPALFYEESHPLYIDGAPYPKGDKKLSKPYFAVAMNSRLQRKNEEGTKEQGVLASIIDPVRTVAFLERGMPGDNKVNKAQSGFDAGPKANPRAFAARHNQRGILVFVDGHAELRQVSELIERGGSIKFPQTHVIWTMDPEDDPN